MHSSSPIPEAFQRRELSKKTLSSPRFQSKKDNVYQRVLTENVAGYWLCRGAAGSPQKPASCDIVVYFLHGGGYTNGHPSRLLNTMLRVAEIAAQRGITFSCFALQYSYAPEQRYPTQLNQASEGYKYLLQEEGIEASKLAVLGDSAGAHLVLCLLARLSEEALPKPKRGVFLQSPWIDLQCSPRPSWEMNKYKDFLSAGMIRKAGEQLFYSRTAMQACPYVDFTQTTALPSGTSWKDVLPARVWISVGSHEVFLDEIHEFASVLRGDGVMAEIEVEKDGIHVWQAFRDVFDYGSYFKCESVDIPEGLLMGANNIAEALLKDVR